MFLLGPNGLGGGLAQLGATEGLSSEAHVQAWHEIRAYSSLHVY